LWRYSHSALTAARDPRSPHTRTKLRPTPPPHYRAGFSRCDQRQTYSSRVYGRQLQAAASSGLPSRVGANASPRTYGRQPQATTLGHTHVSHIVSPAHTCRLIEEDHPWQCGRRGPSQAAPFNKINWRSTIKTQRFRLDIFTFLEEKFYLWGRNHSK